MHVYLVVHSSIHRIWPLRALARFFSVAVCVLAATVGLITTTAMTLCARYCYP